MARKSKDVYFAEIADLVSSRSTCLRNQVGAVLVKEGQILSTGYNGAPKGLPHCSEVGCLREKLGVKPGERHELCRGLHAEQNAIIQAAYHGVSVRGAKLYCTTRPCSICTKMLINAGITEIIYIEEYHDPLAAQLAEEAGLTLRRIDIPRHYGRNAVTETSTEDKSEGA
ncbi:MAG: deoxycytidylate deaminase [Candidatus Thorarchaeota archaeon]|nr:MAG: cytidine deaminase [Candidatus Thorarchaeota archaeon]RLI61892.1 MAG: cytidine deaminase [Candidatus Thorarchaeota archaeon]